MEDAISTAPAAELHRLLMHTYTHSAYYCRFNKLSVGCRRKAVCVLSPSL